MTDPEAYWESNEEEAAADAAARGKIMTLDDARADLDMVVQFVEENADEDDHLQKYIDAVRRLKRFFASLP